MYLRCYGRQGLKENRCSQVVMLEFKMSATRGVAAREGKKIGRDHSASRRV